MTAVQGWYSSDTKSLADAASHGRSHPAVTTHLIRRPVAAGNAGSEPFGHLDLNGENGNINLKDAVPVIPVLGG